MKALIWILAVFNAVALYAQAPVAGFSATPLAACAGVPIQFTNQSVAGGSPLTSYTWDFGDGNSSSDVNPAHAYTNAGVFTVTLVASAQNGQADAEVKTAYITIHPNPLATFATSGNGCTVPFNVTFNNGSASGAGITYAWNFGNGQTSTAQNPPAVTYSSAGTFQASLTVTNTTTGCTSNTTQSIVVSNFAAGITAPATVCAGTSVSIQDNSTTGANSWSWNFGNGHTSQQQNPSITYFNPGTYTITLTAGNTSSGCQSTITKQITVLPPPIISFTANPLTGCTPATITFTNNSSPGTSYTWDYGDGQTATGQNPPPHIYTSEGIYTVTLTMTGANGCTASKVVTDMIQVFPVVADFIADVTEGCDPLTVQFTESSVSPNPTQNPIVSWLWTFGDGTTYNGQTPPPHVYPLGVYDVSLTVTTQSGCTETHTWTDSITVGHIDLVDFTSFPLSVCAKTDVEFTNLSVIGVPHDPNDVTYSWDFSDPPGSVAQNPSHQFTSDTGYFDVTLIVNYRGCRDTIKKEDVVYIIAPVSLFSPDHPVTCNPESFPVNIHFTDVSKYGFPSDSVYMFWDFADGSPIVPFLDAQISDPDKGSISHIYNNYGSYPVKQVIYNYTTGCRDSSVRTVFISRIDASLGLSNDSICRGGTVQVASTSTSTHPLDSWMYDAPGATEQEEYSVPYTAFTYLPAGDYDIQMILTSSIGCKDTAIATLTVLEFPKAEFSADPPAGCSPFTVTLHNESHPQGNGAPVGTFDWTFLEDNSIITTPDLATTVQRTYLGEDTFLVRLIATDYFGCVSEPDTLVIITTKPVAAFTVDSVVCDMETFVTGNLSTGAGPMTYEWFIDGINNVSVATTDALSYAFDENSSPLYTHLPHQLTLITTDVNGCKDTVSHDMIVSLPVAGIGYTLAGANVNADGSFNCPPVFAVFKDSTESYGPIESWNWTFGDGKSSTLQNPSNTYVFSGTYSTTLTVTDAFGCTSDTVLLNYLSIGGPSADPSWTIVPGVNCTQDILFDIGATHDVSGIVWNTGDGQIVNDSLSFVHIYPADTPFEASVIISDSLGCEVPYPLPLITIPGIGLNAFFTSNLMEASLEGTFTFTDGSSATTSIVSWAWDFGDGTGVTNTSGIPVTHIYTSVGNHIVTLTITDINGCTSEYQITVFVFGDFDIPNVFTPNGDNSNDHFTLMHDIFRFYDILIFNRWGDLVEKKENHTGILLWDGRNQGGKECVDGVYFYKLSGTLYDGTQLDKSGFVTLIRTEK